MKDKIYAVRYEHGNDFVGTLAEIFEWVEGEGVSLYALEVFETGKKVKLSLTVEEK
jgi:hypothetical protein